MRRRPSARLLILDPEGSLLLFRFVHKTGALAGKDFWATPGGGLKACETFADAAIRELKEETGIVVADVGEPIAYREFVMEMPDGEMVVSTSSSSWSASVTRLCRAIGGPHWKWR